MKPISFVLFLLIVIPSISSATDIRGRVDISHSYSSYPFPANNIEVRLFALYPNTSVQVATYFTGHDGMYFFYGLQPGRYLIFIPPNFNFDIIVNNVPRQDIRPLLISLN
jgi:hypothetical protein